MKTIIAGGRDITDYCNVPTAIAASGFEITEVVSAKARGFDTLGEGWADENYLPVKPFPADLTWSGKRAGMIRNRQMRSSSLFLPTVTSYCPSRSDQHRLS